MEVLGKVFKKNIYIYIYLKKKTCILVFKNKKFSKILWKYNEECQKENVFVGHYLSDID